jgi:hypothetical protein
VVEVPLLHNFFNWRMRMKKSVVLLLIVTFSLFFVDCSKQTNKTNQQNPQNQIQKTAESSSATVQLISQNNMEHWKISLFPNLAFKTEFVGDIPAQNPNLKLKTDGKEFFSVSTLKFEPHSTGFESQGVKDYYFGKVEIDLSWQENGKEMNGKALYEIKHNQ